MADVKEPENQFKIEYNENAYPTLIKEHFHNSYEIIYVTEGVAEFTIAQKTYQVDAHTLVFVNNFESHKSTIVLTPYRRYFMLLSQEYLRNYINDPVLLSIFKQRPNAFHHLIKLEDTHHQIIQNYFHTMQNEFVTNKQYSHDIIGSTINLMLIHLFRNYNDSFPSKTPNATLQLVSKVEKYIESNYTDDISLKRMSEDFNIDMYYLSRLFKDITGFGFKEYLIAQRLSYAKELLINTNETITYVCTTCGFNSINHFIRIFKEKVGRTPLQFRKQL